MEACRPLSTIDIRRPSFTKVSIGPTCKDLWSFLVAPSCAFWSLSTGELQREDDVLEWLVQNKSTGDEDDVIEDVTPKTLATLISNIDNLVVLFCM